MRAALATWAVLLFWAGMFKRMLLIKPGLKKQTSYCPNIAKTASVVRRGFHPPQNDYVRHSRCLQLRAR